MLTFLIWLGWDCAAKRNVKLILWEIITISHLVQSNLSYESAVYSPQPVMSQPYLVPIPLPQSKSRPLPDSRGIPDTFNLFLFGKPIGPDETNDETIETKALTSRPLSPVPIYKMIHFHQFCLISSVKIKR